MNHELGRQFSMVMVLWKRHTPGGKAVFWNMPKWSSKFPYFKEFHGILILSETGNVWHDFAGSNIKAVSRSVFKTPVLSINIYLKALCTEAVIGILKTTAWSWNNQYFWTLVILWNSFSKIWYNYKLTGNKSSIRNIHELWITSMYLLLIDKLPPFSAQKTKKINYVIL